MLLFEDSGVRIQTISQSSRLPGPQQLARIGNDGVSGSSRIGRIELWNMICFVAQAQRETAIMELHSCCGTLELGHYTDRSIRKLADGTPPRIRV